jgi:hypothetical protein
MHKTRLHVELLEQRMLLSFQAAKNYPANDAPNVLAAAQFRTGTGLTDLAVANFSSVDTASVLLGKGNGAFRMPVGYAAGNRPHSVAVGDMNCDGNQDMVVANFDDDMVTVHFGTGTGRFFPPLVYSVGDGPTDVQVADFNGDGKPDIATANINSNNLSVLLGNCGITFTPLSPATTGAKPYFMRVSDLNADGKLDIAICKQTTTAEVAVLLGNGDGTFALPTYYQTNDNPSGIAVGDIDNDSDPDIMIANADTNVVGVLLNNGNGTFQAVANFATGPATAPVNVVIGDFGPGPLDGVADYVVSKLGTAKVAVCYGPFPFFTCEEFGVGSGPRDLITADFNQDSLPDLAVVNTASDNVSILLHQPVAGLPITDDSVVSMRIGSPLRDPAAIKVTQQSVVAQASKVVESLPTTDGEGNVQVTLVLPVHSIRRMSEPDDWLDIYSSLDTSLNVD